MILVSLFWPLTDCMYFNCLIRFLFPMEYLAFFLVFFIRSFYFLSHFSTVVDCAWMFGSRYVWVAFLVTYSTIVALWHLSSLVSPPTLPVWTNAWTGVMGLMSGCRIRQQRELCHHCIRWRMPMWVLLDRWYIWLFDYPWVDLNIRLDRDEDDKPAAICHLPSSAADPIPTFVLQQVIQLVASYFTELFNHSLAAGHFPSRY